jgi:hypothetical protein
MKIIAAAALMGLAALAPAAPAAADGPLFTKLIDDAATATAADRYDMPTNGYDELNAKLIAGGYREVRVLDAEAGRLSAIDADGSEVLLIADTTTRRILEWHFVHDGDR